MQPKYQKGQEVQIYSPGNYVTGIIADVRQKDKTWEYSLLNPKTNELYLQWEKERWLHPIL